MTQGHNVEDQSQETVFVVSASVEDAERVAVPLRAKGWQVHTEFQNPADACWRIGQCKPNAIVISLDNNPETGCDLACALTVAEVSMGTPILFVGGTMDDLITIGEQIPGAVFVDDDDITWALRRLLYRQ